jgi:ankyrin repeat protein
MVRRGADANSLLENGGSVLHRAASYCILEVVQSLIFDGFADIDVRDRRNRTPLQVVGLDRYLGYHDDPFEREVMLLLVDAGTDIHAIDCERRGVLHHAVQRRRVTWLPILLEQGADPNQRDIKGQTPMVWLLTRDWEHMRYPATPVLSILLEAGADPFREDHAGNSAPRLLAKSEFGRAFMREDQPFFRRARAVVAFGRRLGRAQRPDKCSSR